MNSEKLSVIFPIYNEEETIEKTLLEWKNTLDNLQINSKFCSPVYCKFVAFSAKM